MRVTSKFEGMVSRELTLYGSQERGQWQWDATFLIPATPDGQMGHPQLALVLYLPSPLIGAWCQVMHVFVDPLGISDEQFSTEFRAMMDAARQMRTDQIAVPSNGRPA